MLCGSQDIAVCFSSSIGVVL